MIVLLWFVIGAGMGSVANALIDRLPRGESWAKGRSHCDKCGYVLGVWDLVPIMSYLWLGGKCRYCQFPIPYRNFIVELIMAVGVSYLGYLSGLSYLMGIYFVTVVIAVMDWETRLVSEKMILIWGFLVVLSHLGRLGDLSYLGGLLAAVGIIGGMWAVSRGKAMGFGDVEIAAVIGWWLGWPRIAPALWIAFVVGAAVGVIWVIRGIGRMKSEIAFGPFLILGSWAAYLWGDKIWTWVFRF